MSSTPVFFPCAAFWECIISVSGQGSWEGMKQEQTPSLGCRISPSFILGPSVSHTKPLSRQNHLSAVWSQPPVSASSVLLFQAFKLQNALLSPSSPPVPLSHSLSRSLQYCPSFLLWVIPQETPTSSQSVFKPVLCNGTQGSSP